MVSKWSPWAFKSITAQTNEVISPVFIPSLRTTQCGMLSKPLGSSQHTEEDDDLLDNLLLLKRHCGTESNLQETGKREGEGGRQRESLYRTLRCLTNKDSMDLSF